MVFVIDTNKKPLHPCREARARVLLKQGKAAVWRMEPFTIILKRSVPETVQGMRLKFDPGSRYTGVAVLSGSRVVWLGRIKHRTEIKKHMDQRRAYRRRRRNANLRYRQPRFDNRTKPKGWLAPSAKSRVDNISHWTKKLMRLIPISEISVEDVKFDTQLMVNPEIKGVQYQQGELAGYEVREYLLEKFHRKCAYCGAENVPLEIEHIVPKSRGGTNRISNLTLACHDCNQKKGNRTAEEFGHPEVQKQAKAPLKDAAAVNTIRHAIYDRLKGTGLKVERGSGGLTKYNRTQARLPKEHYYDACCVGRSSPRGFVFLTDTVQVIEAKGRGQHQRTKPDKYGFPRLKLTRKKVHFGFMTGDMVVADVTKGKKQGRYRGRVAVRASGSFNITTNTGTVQGILHKDCRKLQRADGYGYYIERRTPIPLCVTSVQVSGAVRMSANHLVEGGVSSANV